MRIAIDCRKINDGGIGTYLRNLLRQWQLSKAPAEFFLFYNPAQKDQLKQYCDFAEIIPYPLKKYSLGELYSFSRPLKEIRAQLLFSPHYTLPFNLPCPSVVTIHDLIHLHFQNKMGILGRNYARIMINHAGNASAVVLTDSLFTQADIGKLFPSWSGKTRVVYAAVDSGIFKKYSFESILLFEKKYSLPEEFVLYVGALKRHKNPKALIAIVNDLKFPLVIASGDRELYLNEIYPLIADHNLIHFISSIDDTEMALLYNSAKLLIFPSFYEGFGLPPLEAMACGLPVVSSNAASLPEVIGDAALGFSPFNLEQMKSQILYCWNDRAIRDKLAEAGLKQVERFSWQKSAGLIFEIFGEIHRHACRVSS
jgi:glycosyltransferase involved in cell wall biosynthesis